MPLLFVAYPVLAHLATLLHSQRLAWLALTVLVAAPLVPALRRGSLAAWLALCTATAAFYFCAQSGLARYLMFVPPILIPASVFWLFASSLRSGNVPIISRIARQIRGSELPLDLLRYTRRVTQLWALLLALFAVGSLALALWASPALWSLMTNVVQYLVLAGVFPLEYCYRRWRFRHLPHESFMQLVTALFTTRLH